MALLKERFGFIDRISVAVYDAKTDLLKTYLYSSDDENPLVQYSAKLSDSESMQEILRVGRPRVVNDLDIFKMLPLNTRAAWHPWNTNPATPCRCS